MQPVMKLPQATLALADTSLQYSSDVARRRSQKDSCVLFTVAFAGTALVVAISLSAFMMSDSTSQAFSAQAFMTNMLATLSAQLVHYVEPVVDHLHTSLIHIRFSSVDTWDAMSALTPWRLSFLNTCMHNSRGLVFDLANMAFDRGDLELASAVEEADVWGDDRAIGTTLYVGADNGFTNTTEVRLFDEEGSNTNDWYISIRDDVTYEEIPNLYFPISADPRTPPDYRRRDLIEPLWRNLHEWDLQPRQVYFGEVYIEYRMPPDALFTVAVMPVYERNTPGADPGRRVRVIMVGFALDYLSEQLSKIELQGGFVFLVEKSSGMLVAASDPTVSVMADGPSGTNTELIKPRDSNHSLVRGAAVHLQSTDSWPTLSEQLVEGEIDGVNHFFQCFLFSRYNFSLVGVYVIPTHVLLGDIPSKALEVAICDISCSMALVICIFVGASYRFLSVQRNVQERKLAVELKVQEITLAVGIAEKLAHYDLRAAEEILNEQASVAENVTTPLRQLLDNLTSYAPFLPDSLFGRLHDTAVERSMPNVSVAAVIGGQVASLQSIEACARQLRDPRYTLLAFIRDVETAFPELSLYTTVEGLSSGLTARDQLERTMGALCATYCLLRLDMDGQEILSFGVDASGLAFTEPQDHHDKTWEFHSTMDWLALKDLVFGADLLRFDTHGKIVLRHDRVVAMLVFAVIHDAMKNTAWLPRVHHQHAPYCGHGAGDCIHDRDIALAYVIERFPQLLPSFDCLEPGQRAPILFAQVKMGFNNSWLVHGEAPPRVLFSKFKQVITRGRVSQVDINFYFVHWFTHITGAVVHRGRPWHGVEKCATQSSIRVLRRFVDSFGFVDRLASDSEVHVMEDYLSNRWEAHGLPFLSAKNTSTIALQRLTLMAQGFEREVVDAFSLLPPQDQICLSDELARTGHKMQFQRAPASVTSKPLGPALMVDNAHVLLQSAGAAQAMEAMMVLAAVLRAGRRLFPCQVEGLGSTATIRIEALEALLPTTIAQQAWYVARIGNFDAQVIQRVPVDVRAGGTLPLDVQKLCANMDFKAQGSVAISDVWPASTELCVDGILYITGRADGPSTVSSGHEIIAV